MTAGRPEDLARGEMLVRSCAYRGGTPYVSLHACEGYEGEYPAHLSVEDAKDLRDWLTAWLEQQA